VREPPEDVTDADVLAEVRTHWDPDLDAVEHLPVGFGAYHWAAKVDGERRLFVTLDRLLPRHTAESLEGAYAGAAALAEQGLEFVVASLPSRGHFTQPFVDGAISAAPWVEGVVAGDGPLVGAAAAEENARLLGRLHAAPPPSGLPEWAPLVPPEVAEILAAGTLTAWDTGPFGERARLALRERLADLARWASSYHRLAARAGDRPWVATHGEPNTRNQLTTAHGTRFVDWESLKLAPRERDLRTLVDSGFAGLARPDWAMVEMFDLEWRLDEVTSYARWFSSPHLGSDSDRVALAGLLGELDRPAWTRPA
jgi:spectinomycin phosphotransferase